MALRQHKKPFQTKEIQKNKRASFQVGELGKVAAVTPADLPFQSRALFFFSLLLCFVKQKNQVLTGLRVFFLSAVGDQFVET